MLRKFISSLALAAIVTAPAAAQDTYNFWSGHSSSSTPSYGYMEGQFYPGPAPLGFNLSTFQIWCVDREHTPVQETTVFVTQFTVVDGTTTRESSKSLYSQAAWLATTMNAGNISVNQYAIWAIMHGNACGGPDDDEDVPGLGSCTNPGIQDAVDDAFANQGLINHSEWYVITDKAGLAQEYIAHCVPNEGECTWTPPDSETPTPEPATMSLLAMGLAGLAGKSLRRKK